VVDRGGEGVTPQTPKDRVITKVITKTTTATTSLTAVVIPPKGGATAAKATVAETTTTMGHEIKGPATTRVAKQA
jgi:hypothetical protein